MNDEDAAYEEALRRIQTWSPGGFLDLAIPSLSAIPAEIADLSALTDVRLRVFNEDENEYRYASVKSLAPLAGMVNLQTLDCSWTSVSDLSPLSGLLALQTLDCSLTSVSDLSPLSGLLALQTLDCSSPSVSDLSPLSGLLALQTLSCSSTSVSDLSPLSGLLALQTLYCSHSSVSDLSPLSGLLELQTLSCSSTSVSDLSPLEGLDHLRRLDISSCSLSKPEAGVWNKESLRQLIAYRTVLLDVPAEVLSRDAEDDCLARLRAHWQDSASGSERLHDTKLMVLGNGRVGKTQLCRWLRKEPFDESVPSTHGVTVTSIPVTSNPDARLHLWDFGGQDIYHATHSLFLRSRALFVIAWTPALEKFEDLIEDGRAFQNYPLPYWLDYIHEFGGTDAHLIIVQTQCDSRDDDAVLNPDALEKLQRFRRQDTTVFSAKTERRGKGLLEMIDDACSVMDSPLIGVGRAKVKAHLESLRDDDAKETDPDKRANRTMSREAFDTLCAGIGGVVDTELLAEFLHDCGTVFYQQGLFDDRLVIDQAWALEAIYAVFHRDGCLPILESDHGRFTRSLLGVLLWDPQGLSKDEQSTLLGMMISCGICFVYQEADEKRGIEARYIAPELLPVEPPREATDAWNDQLADVSEAFTFSLLTPTLMRSILSEIGSQANLSAHYWKRGVYFYDARRNSRAMIVQTWTGDWSGDITVRCQAGDAEGLLQTLVELVSTQVERLGFKPAAAPERRARQTSEDVSESVPITYGRESTAPQWYVSYARSDATRNGDLVDRFCKHADGQRIKIQRDEEQLVSGDKISRFMHDMASGERIYVFLSEAYLKSIFCMTELHGIWTRWESNEESFAKRVKVYMSDDIPSGDTTHMLAVRDHWLQKLEEFDKIPESDTTPRMRATIDRIKVFVDETYDVLDVIYDHVQFREEKPLFDDVMRED